MRVPLDLAVSCGLHHVKRDHHVVVEDDRVVGLDKAHTAHICCQVEDVLAALADLLAVVEHAEVDQVELIAELGLLQGQRGSERVLAYASQQAEAWRVWRQALGVRGWGRTRCRGPLPVRTSRYSLRFQSQATM